jgi:periplasmic copper chaperone A
LPEGSVQVRDARIRLLPGDLPLAGYFELHNSGDTTLEPDGASNSACDRVMLHRSVADAGISRMQAVSSLKIAPGASVRFAPGGYHQMLMRRQSALHRLERLGSRGSEW